MGLDKTLSQEDMQRIKDNQEDILLHPGSIGKNQDVNCPKIFWNGLGHGSGIGEWACTLNSESYGDLSHGGSKENTRYLPCDCVDYHNCSRFCQ